MRLGAGHQVASSRDVRAGARHPRRGPLSFCMLAILFEGRELVDATCFNHVRHPCHTHTCIHICHCSGRARDDVRCWWLVEVFDLLRARRRHAQDLPSLRRLMIHMCMRKICTQHTPMDSGNTRTEQTGAKSCDDSPLVGANPRDETGGKHPWLYKACHKFASSQICRRKYWFCAI